MFKRLQLWRALTDGWTVLSVGLKGILHRMRSYLVDTCSSRSCCPPCWRRISCAIEIFITDPFVELALTLCIASNTITMALESDDEVFNKKLDIWENVRSVPSLRSIPHPTPEFQNQINMLNLILNSFHLMIALLDSILRSYSSFSKYKHTSTITTATTKNINF